jgi:hypothetical protein
MVEISGLQIGYVPYSADLRQPGDRRRFVHYAHRRGVPFEIADPDKHYDLVVVSQGADVSTWRRYGSRDSMIIYDLIDSYLAVSHTQIKARLRGLAKFATGHSRYLELNYRGAIENMCRRAHAVICTTEEQRVDIQEFCDNVHVILDVHDRVVHRVKTDYRSGETFNLVWEGLGENVALFSHIREPLRSLGQRYPIAVHLVTDLQYGQYLRKYRVRRTREVASRFLDNTYLYEWNEEMCATIITACDLAVIPLPQDDPMDTGKPENKLVLFWKLGMPTVTSATPAYRRAMERAGLSMACASETEWRDTLEHYLLDVSARREAGERGKETADRYYSEDRILAQWDAVIASVLEG